MTNLAQLSHRLVGMTGRDALNRLDASISGMAYAERLEIGALTKCLTDN
jgi:hypothetical protein